MWVEIKEKESLDWLRGLIGNSLAKPSASSADYFHHLNEWNIALANPMKDLPKAEPPAKVSKTTKKKTREARNVKDPFTCTEHKTYTGSRAPRRDCSTCWGIYKMLHLDRYDLARKKFERENKSQ